MPVLWARDRAIVAAINERHENPLLLPGAILDSAIVATSDIDAATADAEAALLAIPAQFLRAVILTLRPALPAGLPVLHCSKGIEAGSLRTIVGSFRRTSAEFAGRGALGTDLRGRGRTRAAHGGYDRQP